MGLAISIFSAQSFLNFLFSMFIYLFAISVLVLRKSKVVTKTNFYLNFFTIILIIVLAVVSAT